MPWRETCAMDERLDFVMLCLRGDVSKSDLCRRYGVSRKTGYKWLERFLAFGVSGLEDRSRAPRHHPQSVCDDVAAMVLSVRRDHPTWGPRKVRAYLDREFPDVRWPAASTIGVLFDRAGLTVPRRFRRRVPARTAPLAHCTAPNAVWTIDFKGWFLTGDGSRCNPLTVQDGHSRYLLRCRALPRLTCRHVWPQLEVAFRAHGLPDVLRSDNGEPFASRTAGGLSRLAVKVVKAGVRPERIEPGKPQQNGRHERLHLTLKQDTASPPAPSLGAQQRRFDRFQQIYNEVRPHEALDQQTPASVYRDVPRTYSGRLRSPEYPDDSQVRRVRTNGAIKWKGREVFISEVLKGEPVGLQEHEDNGWIVCFGPIQLGLIEHTGKFKKPGRWT